MAVTPPIRVIFRAASGLIRGLAACSFKAQQCLYFLPLRHGHFSFLPIFAISLSLKIKVDRSHRYEHLL